MFSAPQSLAVVAEMIKATVWVSLFSTEMWPRVYVLTQEAFGKMLAGALTLLLRVAWLPSSL